MGTREHIEWIQKAAGANVDAIQSGNVPKMTADQDYAELFQTMQSSKAKPYTKQWSEALGNPATSPPAITAQKMTLKLEAIQTPPAQPDPPKGKGPLA